MYYIAEPTVSISVGLRVISCAVDQLWNFTLPHTSAFVHLSTPKYAFCLCLVECLCLSSLSDLPEAAAFYSYFLCLCQTLETLLPDAFVSTFAGAFDAQKATRGL